MLATDEVRTPEGDPPGAARVAGAAVGGAATTTATSRSGATAVGRPGGGREGGLFKVAHVLLHQSHIGAWSTQHHLLKPSQPVSRRKQKEQHGSTLIQGGYVYTCFNTGSRKKKIRAGERDMNLTSAGLVGDTAEILQRIDSGYVRVWNHARALVCTKNLRTCVFRERSTDKRPSRGTGNTRLHH